MTFILDHIEYLVLPFNLVVAVGCALRRDWPHALYWSAAVLITISLIWMRK